MGHTALDHCCLGLIHWHCTAWAEVVEEVGIGHGHSITSCQVRRPNKERARFMGGADRECQVGGRSGANGGWASVKEGHVDPGHGQRRKVAKSKQKQQQQQKVKEGGRRGRRITVLIEYTLSQK